MLNKYLREWHTFIILDVYTVHHKVKAFFFFMGSSFCVLHNNQVFGASDYETIIRPYCEK